MDRRIYIFRHALIVGLLLLGACSGYKNVAVSSCVPKIESAQWCAKTKLPQENKELESKQSNQVSVLSRSKEFDYISRQKSLVDRYVNDKVLFKTSDQHQIFPDTITVSSPEEAWQIHRKKRALVNFIAGVIMVIIWPLFMIGLACLIASFIFIGPRSRNYSLALRRFKNAKLILLIVIIAIFIFLFLIFLSLFLEAVFFEVFLSILIALLLAALFSLPLIVTYIYLQLTYISVVHFGRTVGLIQ